MMQKRQVRICDLKVKSSGLLYCRLIDADTSETLISADLKYIMEQIDSSDRNFELLGAEEILSKIAKNFSFHKQDSEEHK